MANMKTYKSYTKAKTTNPMFIDGERFFELLFLRSYDKVMFDEKCKNTKFFVPKYSYDNAFEKLCNAKRMYVVQLLNNTEILDYSIYEDDTFPIADEETRILSSIMELRKKFATLQLDVSTNILKKYRVAAIQEKYDNDLI